MRILLYYNPDAGHDQGRPDTLADALQRAGHDVESRNSQKHRLADRAVGAFDLVVAAGGDGSVGRTARQMVGAQVPIAVLPLGTANNLAATLDAGRHDLADRIAEWAILPFDAGTVDKGGDQEWFFEGFGIGAFAETASRLTALAKKSPPMPSREAELARDIEALVAAARTQPALEAEIELEGKSVRLRVVMLEVLNISRLGPGVELAPDIDPSDGALDVVVVEEAERAILVDYLEALAANRQPAPPFRATRTSRVRVRMPLPVCVHIDGASDEVAAPVDITVGILPHAVRFLGGTSS